MFILMNCTYMGSAIPSWLKYSIAIRAFGWNQNMRGLNMVHHMRLDLRCLFTRCAPPVCRPFSHLNHVSFYLLLNWLHVCKFKTSFNSSPVIQFYSTQFICDFIWAILLSMWALMCTIFSEKCDCNFLEAQDLNSIFALDTIIDFSNNLICDYFR